MFDVPYISTYYFNPKPTINDNNQIPLYISDFEQSEYLKNDSTKKMDLIYEIDGVEKVIKGVSLGDYTLTLGKLSEGMHTFAVQAYDPTTGLKSHKLYNDLWVINPATYTISASQTYTMTKEDLTKYKIHNDDSKNATDMITTRDGLTQMFADLAAKGYRKVVLLPGTYRINGENARNKCILIPSNFTVDMNKSTFKLNTITSNNEGCIVSMLDVVDAHLINGTLEGDRFERQAAGLETTEANKSALGEAINTILINGGKYCSISDLTIKNTTGHTVIKTYVWGPNIYLSGYTRTAIINGKEVAQENCSTSAMVDITKIIDWEPDQNYMYVGHPEGYRGIRGESAIVYVSFYDANKNFLETVTGYQYRKMKIVDGAKYARVTLKGTYFPSQAQDYGATVSIYGKRYGDYCEITDIDFIDTRTTALAPAVCCHLLIEGCTYTRAGNSITPAAVDLEDGAQECMDVFYRNNKVLVNSGTMTVIDNYGFNHIFEDCEGHSFEIRDRVAGGVVRNMKDGEAKVTWYLGDYVHAAYGRFYNNNCGIILFKKKSTEKSPVNMKVKNCTIRASWMETLPEYVVFENCTFPVLSGGMATLRNCTIQPGGCLGNGFYFYDCTFKALDGSSGTILLNFNADAEAVRVFENCKFVGKFATNACLYAATFRNCEFDDFSIIASVCDRSTTVKILLENCKIRSTADKFLEVGPFTYSSGYLNVEVKNCDITYTGKKFIQITSKTSADSRVLFNNCTVNNSKTIDTSVQPDLIRVINQ